MATPTQIVGAFLDDNNTFTGNNTFEGTTDFDGDVTVETGNTLEIEDDGGLSINSTAVTSTAAELNVLDGVVAGTVSASKAVVVDSNLHQDELRTTTLSLGTSGSVTAVTAVATELNKLDTSLQQETITGAGALNPALRISRLALSGAGAVTLAAPDSSMMGLTKIIEMTEDNGDVTLALTNVQGGTAATTCTWANVGETLALVAGISKWTVVGEGGVVLS